MDRPVARLSSCCCGFVGFNVWLREVGFVIHRDTAPPLRQRQCGVEAHLLALELVQRPPCSVETKIYYMLQASANDGAPQQARRVELLPLQPFYRSVAAIALIRPGRRLQNHMNWETVSVFLLIIALGSYTQAATGFSLALIVVGGSTAMGLSSIAFSSAVVSLLLMLIGITITLTSWPWR
jgi:hypothetical protein